MPRVFFRPWLALAERGSDVDRRGHTGGHTTWRSKRHADPSKANDDGEARSAAPQGTRSPDVEHLQRPEKLERAETTGRRRRSLRPYRYLALSEQDLERIHLVREWVECGGSSGRCARGLRHGPYTFLRYQYWDGNAGRVRYAGEYVPRSQLRRVQSWIRRARAWTALGWGQARNRFDPARRLTEISPPILSGRRPHLIGTRRVTVHGRFPLAEALWKELDLTAHVEPTGFAAFS